MAEGIQRLSEAFDHADRVVAKHGGAEVGGDPTASLEQLEEVARRTLHDLLDSPDFEHAELREVTHVQAHIMFSYLSPDGDNGLGVMAMAIERALCAGALWERERRG